jgi:hypothetical protein
MGATSWLDILAQLRAEPSALIRTSKGDVPSPLDGGARVSLGLPTGQRRDYRWSLPDCRCMHAREFAEHYETHLDQMDPACDLPAHLKIDAPAVHALASTAILLALLRVVLSPHGGS